MRHQNVECTFQRSLNTLGALLLTIPLTRLLCDMTRVCRCAFQTSTAVRKSGYLEGMKVDENT